MEWYTEDFKQKYKELTRLQKSAPKKDMSKISDTISTIHTLLYSPPTNKYQKRSDFLIEQDYKYYSNTPFLWPYLEDFAQTIMPQYYDDEPRIFLLSDDSLFSLVHDFYVHGTDNKTKDLFLKMYKKRESTVKISNNPDISGTNTYSVFLPYYETTYITMNKENTFTDVAILGHEYGHGVQYLTNYSPKIYHTVFSEIASQFFEFLTLYYYSNIKEFDDYALLAQYNELDSLVIYANVLSEEIELLKRIDNKKNIKREISKLLKKDKEMVRLVLEYNPSYNYPHLISGLIAIELIWIYLQDKEEAFNLLRKILNVNYNMNDAHVFNKILSLGIVPGRHLEDYKNIVINNMDKKYIRIRSNY